MMMIDDDDDDDAVKNMESVEVLFHPCFALAKDKSDEAYYVAAFSHGE
jgi:hypothetical protein